MEKLKKNGLRMLACSLVMFMLCGCGITLGPTVERHAIIVQSGTAIECLEQVKVECKLLKEVDGEVKTFKQDIGGWIMFHPDHWKTIKAEFERLKKKAGD